MCWGYGKNEWLICFFTKWPLKQHITLCTIGATETDTSFRNISIWNSIWDSLTSCKIFMAFLYVHVQKIPKGPAKYSLHFFVRAYTKNSLRSYKIFLDCCIFVCKDFLNVCKILIDFLDFRFLKLY